MKAKGNKGLSVRSTNKPVEGTTKYETPLVAEDGLYLYDPYFDLRDERFLESTKSSLTRKLVRCFRKAWRKIPDTDRRTLLDYWKEWPSGTGSKRQPLIGFNMLARCDTAACGHLGRQLDFNALYVDYTEPAKLVCVIGHELGHAISWAHGWFRQHECLLPSGKVCIACECRACSYMAAWGFDVRLAAPLVFSEGLRR